MVAVVIKGNGSVMSSTFEQTKQITNIIQQMLDLAKANGVSEAEVTANTGAGLTVTTRFDEVEKIEHENDKSLSITVFIDNKKGSVSSSDFSPSALKEAVMAACDIANVSSEDPCAGLAEPQLMATQVIDLDLYHPWQITAEQAIDLATECESIARDQDQRINNSDGTAISTYDGNHFYGNTHGFIDGWHWSSHSIDCTIIAETSNGMQRDGWYSKACKSEGLLDIHSIAKEAAKRTVQRLDAKKLSTRQCPVIFEAPVADGLFSAFTSAISGSSLYRKASFLLDTIDKQVFSEHIYIHEKPHLKAALGSAPFDAEGMATKNRDLIVDGILQGYILSSYSARKLGMQATANTGGVHNLHIDSNNASAKIDLAEMIKQMDTGLLITDLFGFGVNQITGDYSRGASGFWVEDGAIQYPVEEITIAGNLKEMYKNITHIGTDVDMRGNILTGSVLLENITVAGK